MWYVWVSFFLGILCSVPRYYWLREEGFGRLLVLVPVLGPYGLCAKGLGRFLVVVPWAAGLYMRASKGRREEANVCCVLVLCF